MSPFRPMAALILAAGLAAPALAAPPSLHETEGTFDDVRTSVEQAIINAGLVIDNTHFVGDMLARTKEDVGGEKDLYTGGDVFTFCSAIVSRQVMERDLSNIAFCPYTIFVYEAADAPGTVVVGHQDYSAVGLPEVQEMLEGIIGDALMLD